MRGWHKTQPNLSLPATFSLTWPQLLWSTLRYDIVLEGQEETGNMVSAKRENLTDVGPKGDMAPVCF